MKHSLIALALLLSLNTSAAGIQGRHRHNASVETVDTNARQGIEAYSDTTSSGLATGQNSTYASSPNNVSDNDNNFVEKVVGDSLGAGRVAIVIVIVLAGLICFLTPFIAIILLVRYFINRHNNRVALLEKAMETGQPIPESLKEPIFGTPAYYWKTGVKNAMIGVGLCLMFYLWHANVLMGVGVLVACLGIGQMIIAKTIK